MGSMRAGGSAIMAEGPHKSAKSAVTAPTGKMAGPPPPLPARCPVGGPVRRPGNSQKHRYFVYLGCEYTL